MNWKNFLKTAKTKLIKALIPGLILVGEGVGVVALVLGLLGWYSSIKKVNETKVVGEVLASQVAVNPNLTDGEIGSKAESWGQIAVDVGGAVEEPGLYNLPAASRVADAVALAGGVTSQADQEYVLKKLNLASKLADQDKVYIPFAGETQVEASSNQKAEFLDQKNNSPDLSKLISINEASLEQLMNLPGVGKVRGQEIIDNRPYSSITELKEKEVVGESVFSKIKELVSL